MNVEQETLGLRRAGFSPALSLLMSAFALLIPPASFTRHLHRLTERSPTISIKMQASRKISAASVTGLAPLHLPRGAARAGGGGAGGGGGRRRGRRPDC